LFDFVNKKLSVVSISNKPLFSGVLKEVTNDRNLPKANTNQRILTVEKRRIGFKNNSKLNGNLMSEGPKTINKTKSLEFVNATIISGIISGLGLIFICLYLRISLSK